MYPDLRTTRRFPCQARFLGAGGSNVIRGDLQDLSPQGLSLVTNAVVKKGAMLHLEFQLPTGEVEAVGEVRRVVKRDGGMVELGIRFSRISTESQDVITRAVASPRALERRYTPAPAF